VRDRYYLMLVSAIAVAAASPALATAAPPPKARPAAKPAVAANQAITRAAMIGSLDTSFKAADTNGDGVLTQAELAAAEGKIIERRVAEARERLDAEFNRLDTNHDGQLSKTEFMAAAPTAPTTPPTGSEVLAAFDKNHDGKVSLDEFRAPRLAAFDKLDTNHDGTISAAEREAATASASRKR
jgi:Ca2+-binding EF-hand superfamily protein